MHIPGRVPSLSMSPRKLLGLSINLRSPVQPGTSHLLFFAVLMLLSVNMEFTEVAHRLWAEVCAGDISRMRDVFVRVAWNLGEAFLLGLAIRRLERAVRIPYFLVLLNINSCHVAGPFVAT